MLKQNYMQTKKQRKNIQVYNFCARLEVMRKRNFKLLIIIFSVVLLTTSVLAITIESKEMLIEESHIIFNKKCKGESLQKNFKEKYLTSIC